MKFETETMVTVGAVAVVAVVALYIVKKAASSIADAGGAAGVAATAAGAVVDAAGGAATGTVVAIGQQFGIPNTSLSACEQAMAEGRTWDASFACPLPVFTKYLVNGYTPGMADAYDPATGNWQAHGPR